MAGISAEYYLRLEQGKDHQPSPQVLLALGRALHLDADGSAYLFRLARQTVPGAGVPRHRDTSVVDGLIVNDDADEASNHAMLLTQWTMAPTYVTNAFHDVLAVNPLGRDFIPFSLVPGDNILEAVVDGALAATDRQDYWDRAVRRQVASLRYCSDPTAPRLQLLVASLSSRSRVFREAWASHEVHPQRGGTVPVNVPPFGYIEFRWQTLEVPGGEQFLTTFFGDPGSPASAAIEFLVAKLAVQRELEKAGPVEMDLTDDAE